MYLNSGMTFNPAIFWRQTNNSIEEITTVSTNGVSLTNKQNVAANRQFGLNLSASPPVNKKWNININSNINKFDYNSQAMQVMSRGWGPNLPPTQAISSKTIFIYKLLGHIIPVPSLYRAIAQGVITTPLRPKKS